jgi:hypothetical protein
MEQSPRLSLSYVMPQQAQKHVTVNETFRRLDALCQLSVRSRIISAEPGSPTEGDAYILPASPSGTAWDNYTAGNIATFQDGAWIEVSAVEGLRAWVEDERKLVVFTATAWKAAAREVLAADRTYYVRSDGDDDNDGLSNSSGGAFATIQKAIDALYTVDWNGFDATIKIAGSSATFTENLVFSGMPAGAGTILVDGDTTTPSNYIVTSSSGNTFTLEKGAQVSVQGFELRSAASRGFDVLTGADLILSGNMAFGAISNRAINVTGSGATITISSGFTVSGNCADFININGGASLLWVGTLTVTLSGAPAWSGRFIKVSLGSTATVVASGITFSGSATGKRYEVDKVGALETFGGGATFFPGDSAGTADAATFGYYG